ncbi:MAG: hypothetical protein ACR2OZ_20930 [Verrucomicrobiales bacterium]
MDALKKNKFLTTFLAVLIGGTLVLGYFLWSTYRRHKAAEAEYEDTRTQVSSLESRPLYPNHENFLARKAQVDGFAAKVNELQTALLTYQQPIAENPDETKFQNKLTETINQIKAQSEFTKLGGSGSGASAEFDLGMGRYLKEIPRRETVPDLEFELNGLRAVVDILLTDRASSIDAITRQELAIETEKPEAAAPAAPGAKAPARAASGTQAKKPAPGGPLLPEENVLKRYPFAVKFTGNPHCIEDVMNHLAVAKEQFFAVRQIRVENEKKDGPTKGAVKSSTSGDAEAQKKDSTVILGGERVTALLAIDLLRFLPPGQATPTRATANK